MDKRRWRSFSVSVDNILIPLTGAFVTVLVAAQCLTAIPDIRRVVDHVDGRFVAYPSSTTYVQHLVQPARIQLYLSPDIPASHVEVQILVNGRKQAVLSTGSTNLTIHNEDVIVLAAEGLHSDVSITVNHDNPAILQPAPGKTIILTPASPRATLGTVSLVN